MVSLWPFKGDNTSAAAFEKTLSTLATKIANASARTDRLRQRARKLRVSWTLYGGFTYILMVLILILVTGRENWAAPEYSMLSGGPVLLYVVRQLIDRWYNYRIANAQDYLDSLFKERDATIEKLKAATKYDSTQQLLDKYGSSRPQTPPSAKEKGSKSRQPSLTKPPQGDRVFTGPPPPTANIARPPTQAPGPINGKPSGPVLAAPASRAPTLQPSGPPITEEFAPNAFSPGDPIRPPMPRYPSTIPVVPRWYDRLLDALIGEDETQNRNRFALICSHCRLVNGQAPPGVKSPEEVGRWRCQACKEWNGVEDEAEKVVAHARKNVSEVDGDSGTRERSSEVGEASSPT